MTRNEFYPYTVVASSTYNIWYANVYLHNRLKLDLKLDLVFMG